MQLIPSSSSSVHMDVRRVGEGLLVKLALQNSEGGRHDPSSLSSARRAKGACSLDPYPFPLSHPKQLPYQETSSAKLLETVV